MVSFYLLSVQVSGMSSETRLPALDGLHSSSRRVAAGGFKMEKLSEGGLALSWDEGRKEGKSFPEQAGTGWPVAANRRMTNASGEVYSLFTNRRNLGETSQT